MDEVFVYSKFVTGKNFIGRKKEVSILANFLSQGENVVIYEPAKTGKMSLIQQACYNLQLSGSNIAVAEVSLLNVRSAEQLMVKLGSTVIRLFASTPQEFADTVRTYLGGTHFIFDHRLYADTDQIISLNWEMDDNDVKAVFSLPFRMSFDNGKKCAVLLREFQDILLCDDGEKLCKLLEETFRENGDKLGSGTSYILCGSKVNAMKYIFEHKRFFYRVSERLKIPPIDSKDIIDAATRGFLTSGKVIDRNLMLGVCKLFRNNIWYINHFSAICDSLSKGYIMEPVLLEGLDTIISIHEPRFAAITEDLTTFQVSLLRAIMEGHTKFSSAEVIEKYALNSSANVRRLKDALCKKEIVTFNDKEEPEILDPLFEYWLGKYYFGIKA